MNKVVKFEYQGNDITFDFGNGEEMINATEMGRMYNRSPSHFLRNEQTESFVVALRNRNLAEPVIVKNGGYNNGTWMQYKLALKFAAWLSPDFELWIYDRIEDLLKTGSVSAKNEHNIPQTLSGALMLAAKQAEQLELNEATLKEQAPKVLFADSVTTSKDSILIGDLAKIMKQNGIDIGQNRLFEWMRNNGFLCRSGSKWNRPTQRAMEMGLFEVLQRTINIPNSEPRIQITTKCTGTGQIYFINKFLKE